MTVYKKLILGTSVVLAGAFSGVAVAGCANSVWNEAAIPQGDVGTFSLNAGALKADSKGKVKPTRSEKRCGSVQNEALVFSAQVKIHSGDNVSIVQFLNVRKPGKKSGSSEAIAQLVFDRSDSGLDRPLAANEYRVSIEQGNQYCGFTMMADQWYPLTARVDAGGSPEFTLGDNTCVAQNDRKAGQRGADENLYYYLKYGAYAAAKNTQGGSVSFDEVAVSSGD